MITTDYDRMTPEMLAAVEDARTEVEAATNAWIESALIAAPYERLIAAHEVAEAAWRPVWLAAPVGSLLRAAAQDAKRGHHDQVRLVQEWLGRLLEARS